MYEVAQALELRTMQWQTISDRIKCALPVVLKDVFGPQVLFVMLHVNKKS